MFCALLADPSWGQDQRPAYSKLRYDEDWSFLRDPERRTEPLDPLKFIPLDDEGLSYLSVGGETRQRYEYTRHPAWGSNPQDLRGVFLQRYTLHGDLHLGPHVRLFGQLYSALETGRAGAPSPIDENRLDLQQAFIDVSIGSEAPVDGTLRLGRQEMAYGSSRLIDVREGPNVRRKFDGARLLVASDDWRFDVIAVRPSRIEPGVFDDGIDSTQTLWGIYSVHSQPAWLPRGSSLDLYYLGYRNEAARFDQGTADETRHTLGARLWGRGAGWDWNWEAIAQGGRFGTGDVAAWSLATDTGYTWAGVPWTPRLGLSANVASGDRNPGDADLQTFNPLFPRGNYFSELALLGPRNFFNLHPSVTAQPTETLSLTADIDFFWRLERDDGIYGPGGALLRSGSASNARYVSTEVSLNATWQISQQVSASAIYAHSLPGAFIRETGPAKNVDFFEVTLKAQF